MTLRFRWALLLALLAAPAFADDPPNPPPLWKSIVVRYDLGADGTLHVTERADVTISPQTSTIERTYWSDGEQVMTINRLTRIDPETGEVRELTRGGLETRDHFETPWPGHVKWSVAEVTAATYVIESTISDAVIPAWSLPRGRLSRDTTGLLGDPRVRFKEMLPVWREAAKNPRRRYLLDVQYDLPPAGDAPTEVRFELNWANGWEPSHAITSDTVARRLESDFYNPTRFRLTHLFDFSGTGTPRGIDVRRHALRAAAIVGFPLACLFLWLLFVLRELFRSSQAAGDVDENALETMLFNEPPELIAARWSGRVNAPRIEPFLRRLERQRKLSIAVDPSHGKGDDDEGDQVTLRLLVPREELTDYERAGIDALIADGWETTTAAIRARHGEDFFDPTDALRDGLTTIAAESGAKAKAPWYSQLTSFALFAAGIALLVQEIVHYHREPIMLFAGLILSSMFLRLFPNTILRSAIRDSLVWTLLAAIPAVLMMAAIAVVHLAPEVPPGVYASAGFSLVLLATYKANLAATATREPRPARARRRELSRVRAWARAELATPQPRLRDESIPWLEALGLSSTLSRWRRRAQSHPSGFGTTFTGNAPPAAEEGWGEGLVA
jgi:hypothetical protein